MKFQYKNITPGYLGIKEKNQTLNSSFYAEFFGNNLNIDNYIIFPQRIPKIEFFEEILSLEKNEVKKHVQDFLLYIKKSMYEALEQVAQSKKDSRTCLNWMNILLRYGLANDVVILPDDLTGCIDISDQIEFLLLKEIAKNRLRTAPTFTSNTSINDLIKLSNTAIKQKNLNDRVKIIVLNFIIVAVYRFGIRIPYEPYIKICSETLINLIEQTNHGDLGNSIRASIAYRGLSMITELGPALQNTYLKKAEEIARGISQPSNKTEEIIIKENLYTCLQTLSKWNLHNKKPANAEINLTEMISIDPFDSTGHAEMGFFLLNQSRYKEASIFFNNAIKLGPPAAGMHAYYYAKSMQEIGKIDEAILAFKKATKLDNEAISPWLDLLDLYLENNETKKAKKIATLILNTPVYKEQIEDDEHIKLKLLTNQACK